jgi:hypothetical protein
MNAMKCDFRVNPFMSSYGWIGAFWSPTCRKLLGYGGKNVDGAAIVAEK